MKEFLYTLLVDFGPRFLELALLAFGIWLINQLRKQGASKEQIALVEEAYEILSRAARNTN